jgi:hypothetical protein
MCRNIHTLYNVEPPATEADLRNAALQFVRKVSGYRQPSKVNEPAFLLAVEEFSASLGKLVSNLDTNAPPRSREKKSNHPRVFARINVTK